MSARDKSRQVTKIIAQLWGQKSTKEKEEYALKRAEDEKRRKEASERGENVINLDEPDHRVPRVSRCRDCGKVCLGEQSLMRHQIAAHGEPEARENVEDLETADSGVQGEALLEEGGAEEAETAEGALLQEAHPEEGGVEDIEAAEGGVHGEALLEEGGTKDAEAAEGALQKEAHPEEVGAENVEAAEGEALLGEGGFEDVEVAKGALSEETSLEEGDAQAAKTGDVQEATTENADNTNTEIVLVQHLRNKWPAQVIERDGRSVKVQIFNKKWAQGVYTTVDEAKVSAFEYNEAMLKKTANNELKSAYNKAQKLQSSLIP